MVNNSKPVNYLIYQDFHDPLATQISTTQEIYFRKKKKKKKEEEEEKKKTTSTLNVAVEGSCGWEMSGESSFTTPTYFPSTFFYFFIFF